ncbi:MAG: rhodanese-like domain-containing protein [Muribaculaceae bacterium]|nr:rhodanese-like domain-containing protein [Muribaculaceae bacterium]
MKYILIIAVVLVIGIVIYSSCATKNNGFKTVGVDEFSKLIADRESIQLVDMRTLSEYNEGHIAGAKLIDVNDSLFIDKVTAQLDKQKTVAVYCRSGRRSAKAANAMVKAGFQVINLDGGIIAWQDAGKDVE